MFTTRLRVLSVFVVLAAAGSGLLLAQSPQTVGTWVGVGTADNPFGNGASVALSDGRTLVVGGAGLDGAATNVVSSFDTATNQFAIAGTLLSARTGHTTTLLQNGRVLVTGGIAGGLLSTEIELFDPSTGASTLIAQMPEPRRGHVAALLQNGRVLIAGGYTTGDVVLQSAFVFDPATNSVSPTPGGLHIARASASATSLIDGRVVIVGGTDGTNDLRSAEIYDPYLQSFTTASTELSVPVHGHSAVLLPHNGSVLIAGGTSDGVAQAGAELFLPAEFPDPFSWGIGQFAPTAAMNVARSKAISGPTAADGYAVVTGGGSNGVERYRFATIKTDKDDYPPGQRAIITGSGWQVNEEVRLLFQEDPAVHDDYELTVTADGAGNIYHDTWAPEEHDANVRFYLMAVGQQSGRRAQMTFTDSTNFQNLQVGGQSPDVVAQGSSATFVVTVSFNTPGGATSCQVGSFVANNLPAGATASFVPSSVTGTTAGDYPVTMTVNTTAATPTGTFSGGSGPEVTATSVGCGSVGAKKFTLRVGTPTSLVLSAPSPASVTQGSTGPVTLSATLSAGASLLSGQPIAFIVDGVTVGSGNTIVSGVATLSYNPSALSVGPRTVTAFYAGANVAGTQRGSATSNAQTLTVTSASVVTTTSINASGITYGQNGSVTVTVSANSGSNTPTGNVSLSVDGGAAVTKTLVNGSYTFTVADIPALATPSAGNHPLSASYAGATGFNASGPTAGTLTVAKAPVTASAGSGSGTYNGQTQSPDSCVVSGPYVGDLTCANNPLSVGPNVGTFAIAPVVSGTGLTNYDITPVNGSYTISEAPVTATGGSGSGPYNGQTQSPDSCVVSGAYVGDLTCANNPLSVGPNVGTFAIAPLVSGTGQANFEITLTNGSYTISKALVTATAGSGSGTYNGQTQSPSACAVTGTYKGDLTCANNPVSVGPDVGTFAIAPVVSGTGQANFEITLTDGSYTISKALVTATAGSGSGSYNGQTQSPAVCAVTGTYTGDLTCANNPTSVGPDVGTFPIAPVVSGTGQANFEITLTDGSYTISKALVTATAGSGSGSYNGQTQSPAVCAVTGTYTGDLTCANNPASVGPDVGTFPIAPVVSGTGQANFEITLTDGSYTISKALVTATAGSGSGSYNGQTQSPAVCAVTGTYTGNLTCANNPASVGPDVGTFPIAPVVSGTGQANFEITLTDGSYTISKALVTATAGSGSGSYNGQTQSPAVCAVTGTYTGDLTCANNPTSVGPDVGTFPIAPVVSGTGQANFEITLTDGSYTISKALVTATAGSGSGSYNGQTQSPSACAVTGTYTGDLTCANNPASVGPDVGTFPIAPVVSGTGQANFEITLTDGSYTISKALVTATAGSGSGSYNGQTQSPAVCAVTGTYTGDLTCANNPASVGPDVGTFPIAPVVSGSGQANFEITLTDGSYTISKALVTATAGSGSGSYNGQTQSPAVCAVTGTYTGALTCANNPASVGPDVGTFPIAPVVSGTGQANFEITLTDGSYTISKALVTATGGSGSATYNGQTHAPSACVVTGTYTGALTCANNPASVGPDVGTFAIAPVVSGSGQSNFEVTLTNGSYTISKALVTATGGSGSATYNGLTHAPSACVVTGTYTGALTCANNPVSVGPDVGMFAIAPVVGGSGQSNFEVTLTNGSYTISKAPVTATAGSGSGVFSGFTQSPSACAVTGAYTGNLTCANNPASAGPGVGTYVIAPVVSGTGLGNYYITAVNGSYTISAWNLTGFYQPVGIPNSLQTPPGGTLPITGILNTIKGGQTVPLKFEIFETIGGTERTSVSAVLPFTLTPVACDGTSSEDPVDFTTTGGTSLRYDGIDGQFIQNWQSPKPAGKCYRATMTALDGSSISAFFKTK